MARSDSVTHDVRILAPDQLRAAHATFIAALHHGPGTEAEWERAREGYVPGRTLGVLDGAAVVGTADSFSTRTAVPGGSALATSAVTGVGVRPDHTRRGILTALMRTQLEQAAAAGEVLAQLRASEARIYGRFGYGVATRARKVSIRLRSAAGLRADAPAGGAIRVLEREEIVDVLAPLHAKLALRRVGGIERSREWWWWPFERQLDERAHMIAAVHTGPDGDDGFFVATSTPGRIDFEDRGLYIPDMHVTSGEGAAALWRFALSIDLIADLQSRRPLDDPLDLLLADPRDCRTIGIDDETWLRIVDVPTALAARSYAPAEPVLLGVTDAMFPGNDGVYRIADGAAKRVDGATAQLECGVAGLSMAYLGDRRPSELVASGWWRAVDLDAVTEADAAFATATVPWCGTSF